MNELPFLVWALVALGGGLLVHQRWRIAGLQAEQRRYQAIFDNAMVGMANSTPDLRWITVNSTLCRILDQNPADLSSIAWLDCLHPEDRSVTQRLVDAIQQGERDTCTLEARCLRRDGSVVFVNLGVQAIRGDSGELDSLFMVIEDITQRQVAETQFANQVNRSLVLIELPRQAELLDEREFMRYALERAEALTGSRIGFMHFVNDDGENIELAIWTRNTVEHYCTAVVDRHYPISKAGIWADAARTGQAVMVNDYAAAENKRGLPEGHSQLTRLLSVPVVENGVVRMLAGVGNKESDYAAYDSETVQLIANETWRIVRRQRADRALRLAMQVVNASPVVCFRWAATTGWPVVFVSENVRQWGYSQEQLQSGKPPFSDIVHPDDLPRVCDEVARHTTAGLNAYEQEYRLITAQGEVIWVVDRTKVSRDAQGRPTYYDGVITDISERKRQQLLIADTLAQQRILNKRLEEANNQLLQSEKMASIGQLAAGIAHELNNPIGFVHSNLGTLDGYVRDLMAIIDAYAEHGGEDCPHLKEMQLLREERDFDFVREDIFKLLAESKDGLSRVRKIVQDLRTFSRVGEQEWQEADLHEGLDSTLNIVWNELKYKCEVIKDYGDLPPVYCLISQLNQVFMNLLVNAGHAIAVKGTITIRTRQLDEARVSVEISDTGCGIAPENVNRIFEPFFTTKPVGKGTGLGLSLAYGIIQRHQGSITVTSEPGRGSTFRVILPIRPHGTGIPEDQP
jgi:PAS domain S-box-containing protein